MRRSATPDPRATAAADVDIEQDFRVIADEADRRDQQLPYAGGCLLPDKTSSRAGPIHGSGVRPALWNAHSYSSAGSAATPRAVAATWSA